MTRNVDCSTLYPADIVRVNQGGSRIDVSLTELAGSAVQDAALAARSLSRPVLYANTLTKWPNARSKVRSGSTNARIALYGDSKTAGAGAGTGAQFMDGAFPKSRAYRMGQLLVAAGTPTILDTWFGAAELATVANVLAYDTRRTGFSGWTLGNLTMGGRFMSCANTNPGNFQPSKPVDRCSVFHLKGVAEGQFTVSKGAETFPVTSLAGTSSLERFEIQFTTKDANPIIITRTTSPSTNQIDICGMVAWDSAAPGVELANFGRYGITSAAAAAVGNPWSPLTALGTYAPDLT
ncbi:hypothetical protein BH09PSE3_BH09PSE3_23370 [soil metagenome]